MLRCLDPALAEICYIDTDSVLFSLGRRDLLDCIRPEKMDYFKVNKILADESAAESCHGKMKLEGTFEAGRFKSLKIYRLFSAPDTAAAAAAAVDIDSAEGKTNKVEHLKAAYTRCKGVNRYLATRLSDQAFDFDNLDRTVIHRTSLRPIRTGEMVIAHESRTLSVPFNLKRWTTDDGYHTFPISYFAEHRQEFVDDDEDDDEGGRGHDGSGAGEEAL